jgi:hypothetical protein
MKCISNFLALRRRFGFSNPEALAAGQTGTACCGEEHDVTLVWSRTSGKRVILADGQEVHHSNSRGNFFDVSWTMKGNHVLKLVAHASPPRPPTPGFRQYDFFVNGKSFFNFPKAVRLGIQAGQPRGTVSPRGLARRTESSRGSSAPGSPPTGSVGTTGNIASQGASGNRDKVSCALGCFYSLVHRPFMIFCLRL